MACPPEPDKGFVFNSKTNFIMRAAVILNETGQLHYVHIVKMTGKIYKPGKDDQGKFIDNVGQPDIRYQVYGDHGSTLAHKVYPDKESVRQAFTATADQVDPKAIEFFS